MESVTPHKHRYKFFKRFCLTVVVPFSIALPGLAQVGTSSITGSVTDANGAPIPSATITITRFAIGFERTTQTNEQGTYSFNALAAGTYSIRAETYGFETVRRDNLALESGTTLGVNFTLKPAQVSGEVTITDNSTANISTTLDEKAISNLPRTLLLQLLVPGVLPGHSNNPSLNGSSAPNDKFTVDGANNNDARVGGAAAMPATGATGSLQLVTANYSAETGRLGDNILNIAVKSGTNEFHGTGFLYFRDDSLQARGPFGDANKPSFGSQRFGGSLGGPLKKDVAFFFVDLERHRNNEVTTSGRRDNTQRRVVQVFARVPQYSTILTSKFDLNLSAIDKITARYLLSDSDGITPGVSQHARLQEETNFQSQTDRQHQLTSSWSHAFSSTLNNVALFNFLTFRNESKPVTTTPQIVFPSINVGANFRADQSTLQRRIQFKDDLSWIKNSHAFTFGADYSHLSLQQPNNFNLFGLGIIFVPCDFAGEIGCPTATHDGDIPVQFALINRQTLTDGFAPFGTRGIIPAISDNVLALYAQDVYRPAPNVTLNLGIRWDYDQDFIGRNQTNQARPSRRKSRKKNYQPRLGIVWTIGRVLIRGGYGTYYRQNFLETRQLELLANGTRLPLVRSFGGTLSNPFSTLGIATPPDIFVTNNELRENFGHSFSLAGESELGDFLLSATLILRRGQHAPLRVEVNRNKDGSRVNNQFGSVLETQSIGKSSYKGLSINLRRRFGSGFAFVRDYMLDASYTLSRTTNQANELLTYLSGTSDPGDPKIDRGPSSFDARHRFVFSGIFNLPRGISIAPTVNAHSSLPFEIIQNHDFSEGAASGFYRLPVLGRNAGNRQIRTGADVNRAIDAFNANADLVLAHGGPIAHVDSDVKLSKTYFALALRLSKRFSLGETKSLEIGVDAFNLTNHTNVIGLSAANASGLQNNVESPNFGRPLGVTAGGGVFNPGGPRAFQLLTRFTF